MINLSKYLFILFFLPLGAIAQEHDSIDVTPFLLIDSAYKDSLHSSNGHLKTAGNVWKNVVMSVPSDFVYIGRQFGSNWKKTAAYGGGIALLIIADKPITRWYQDNIEKNIDYSLPKLPDITKTNFTKGNDGYLHYAILSLYGGSLIGNYKTGQRAALNSMKALAFSYVITQIALKAVFSRQRPDPSLSDGNPPNTPFTDNPYNFFNFRRFNFKPGPDGTSFPSMHATAYYSVAKVLAMEFNNYWIPYTAVTGIFFADLSSHQHWVADMVAGGILGTIIGQGIVNGTRHLESKQNKDFGHMHNRSKKNHVTYQILPNLSSQMVGLTFFVSL